MTNLTDWHCAMCGIGLDEATKLRFPMLFSQNILTDKGYYQAKYDTYIWERTQKHPKVTCSWDCGQNYKAWRRTGEPKTSYFATKLDCNCCGRGTTRGRVIKQRRGHRYVDFYMCIDCHRKKEITEGRRLWEILNRDHRNAYHRLWRTNNQDKQRQYKLKYRKRVKAGVPLLGNCRKPICAVHPSLSL